MIPKGKGAHIEPAAPTKRRKSLIPNRQGGYEETLRYAAMLRVRSLVGNLLLRILVDWHSVAADSALREVMATDSKSKQTERVVRDILTEKLWLENGKSGTADYFQTYNAIQSEFYPTYQS